VFWLQCLPGVPSLSAKSLVMMELEYAFQLMMKLTDRCDIACTYCYVFEFDKDAGPSHPAFLSEHLF
jgi:sulfatase maturation enzyme AslB (radical SAM superfamily)